MNGATATVPEMVYAVSHDIGEPMREIIGFAELLSQRAPQDADERFWTDLDHVAHGAVRAREMLEALCDFMRAEELPPEVGIVDLGRLVADAIAATEAVRTDHSASVDVHLEGTVTSYPIELRQILVELVTNAARFGASPSTDAAEILIAGHVSASELHIVVEDQGPGIPAVAHDRALQLFQRLHRRAELDTLGVGLAMIRRRLDACGGSIELGETTASGGLRVHVTLPLPVVDIRTGTPTDHTDPHELAS